MHMHIYIMQIYCNRGWVSVLYKACSVYVQSTKAGVDGRLVMLEFLTFENIAIVSGLTADEHVMFIDHFLTTQEAILQYTNIAVTNKQAVVHCTTMNLTRSSGLLKSASPSRIIMCHYSTIMYRLL